MSQENQTEFKIKIPGSVLLVGSGNELDGMKELIFKQYPSEAGDKLEIGPDESEGKSRAIAIKQVREAQHFINLTPQGRYKVLLITEADHMTTQAANALLKTLEEPPKYALIVMLSTSRNLLPTIISRCQTINLWQSETSGPIGYDFKQILASAFYQQSKLAEEMAVGQGALEFLTQFESWARQEMRRYRRTQNVKLIKDIIDAKKDLRHHVNARLVLENLLLKYKI